MMIPSTLILSALAARSQAIMPTTVKVVLNSPAPTEISQLSPVLFSSPAESCPYPQQQCMDIPTQLPNQGTAISAITVQSRTLPFKQGRAIVTNHCSDDVFVWSIPYTDSSNTENLAIRGGGSYEEAWRYGTETNPGIAIKVSTETNGIYNGQPEINFAYSLDRNNASQIFVGLTVERGFDDNMAFITCNGVFQTANVLPHSCRTEDDVELVLCGQCSARGIELGKDSDGGK